MLGYNISAACSVVFAPELGAAERLSFTNFSSENNLPIFAMSMMKSLMLPSPEAFIASRVSGESMQSAQAESYPDGSIIIVVREKNMKNNTPIIVRNGTETPVFRKLIVDGTGGFLKALNPQYPSANLHDEAVFCGTVKFCIQIA